MKKLLLIALFFTLNSQLSTLNLHADTIYTNDGKEIKGIVVEDYKDRMVVSTVDGEITMMKADVKELYFDTEEQNLIKLAEQARDKGDYIKAFVHYDKAFKLNPDSTAAKDGIIFLQGFLFKKDMSQKEEAVRRHNEYEQRGERMVIESEEEKFKRDLEKMRSTMGIALRPKGGLTEIASVTMHSSAYGAGIRKGDILVAVWGRLVGYMSLREVVETLLEKASLETKCTIERNVEVRINENRGLLSATNDLIGVTLDMRFDGLTISAVKDNSPASESGLKQDDLIVEINGNSTRYMPLKRAVEIIKKSKGDTVNLIIRRDVIIWGKGGE